MVGIRILFADDQIPDDQIPDNKIKATLLDKHPDWPNSFINAFCVMRKAVATLRESGYNVDVATNYNEALEKAKRGGYDLAIVDLGWYADETLPENQMPYAGWEISRVLEIADKESGMKITPQIIYSNRFEEDPSVSIQAADQRKLPLYKIYSDAGHQALRATVKFIEANLSKDPFLEGMKQTLLGCFIEPLKEQRKWFNLTIIFVGLSFILLLISLLTAIYANVGIGVITSVSSVITAAISSLLYKRLDKSQKSMEQSRDKLINLIKDREKQSNLKS
jgi:hypothetical protein